MLFTSPAYDVVVVSLVCGLLRPKHVVRREEKVKIVALMTEWIVYKR
jgi:hypothetical protein